jgi:DNA-binding NtrC family response regulator
MTKDRVLVVEDEASIRTVLRQFLESRGYEVVEAASSADANRLWREAHPDIVLLDYSLPDGNALELLSALQGIDAFIPVIIVTGYGSIELAIEAVKLGAEQFLTKPVELSALGLIVQRSLENQRNRHRQRAENARKHRNALDPFLGNSSPIRRLAEIAKKVAASESPVLIQGETGTGKGVLARWLHQNGSRACQPFIDLNCGGLSRDLLETELFGHERGASTGAVQSKSGLLDIAHKGTMFVDEIGDVDVQVQPKLLKVLEEKQFRRLGDVRDRKVDIRLIAATHHDMQKLVQQRQFRDDLYFRIGTLPLTIPALRERSEDLPLIVDHLLTRLTHDIGTTTLQISPEAMRALQSYSWPGNIRELRNVLERAVLLSGNRLLKERDLHIDLQHEAPDSENNSDKTLDQVERQYILEILDQEGGRVEIAAKKLGIPRSSLYYKLKQYGVSRTGHAAQHGSLSMPSNL